MRPRCVLPAMLLISCGSRADLVEIAEGRGAGAASQDASSTGLDTSTSTSTPTVPPPSAPGATPSPSLAPGPAAAPSSSPTGGASPSDGGSTSACMSTGGGASTGNGECDQTWGISCGGANYQIDCACPRGSCVCFGPTTHVVSYDGCPSCPSLPPGDSKTLAHVFAKCGFPFPQ